jgi:uracil phosphoribosyltransferase
MSKADKKNVSFGPKIHVSSHPVLFHKISILRSTNTSTSTFRSVLKELTYHLGYEATKDLKTKKVPVTVSFGKEKEEEHLDTDGYKLADRVSLIPILRSGLGMMDGMLELLPNSAVYHIGMYRIPGHAPVQYFNRLPRKCESDVAIVLDPVISSSATSTAVIGMLKKVRDATEGTMATSCWTARHTTRPLIYDFFSFFFLFQNLVGRSKDTLGQRIGES